MHGPDGGISRLATHCCIRPFATWLRFAAKCLFAIPSTFSEFASAVMEQRTRQSAHPATRRHDPDESITSIAPGSAEAHDSDATDASKIVAGDLGNKHRLGPLESSSPLERLPAELRDQILLSAPDLPTLRALVHASPVMHAQYRNNRDMLLRTCVGRELDGCFVDAHACLKSRAGTMSPFRTNEKITDLLDAYRGWLSDSGPHADLDSVSPSSVRWLAGFHLSVVRPFSRLYGAWALANLAQATASSLPAPAVAERTATATAAEAVAAAGDRDITLSRSEETRVFRALYRYETYCHLFGRNKAKRRGEFRHAEISEIFFGLFDPWDAEAVGCIDSFVRQKYAVIFREISEELRPEGSRFRKADGSVDPEGSFDLDTSSEYRGKLRVSPPA